MGLRRLAGLLAAVLVGAPAWANAIGAHGGPYLVSVNSNYGSGSSTKYSVGGFYEIALTDDLFLQPELNYVARASTAEYLSVPLLVKWKFHTLSGARLFLQAGPDFNQKVGGFGITSHDIGVDFGGGMELDLSETLSFLVDMRYYIGFTNVYDKSSGSAIVGLLLPDLEITLRGLQLMGAVRLVL